MASIFGTIIHSIESIYAAMASFNSVHFVPRSTPIS